MFKWFCCQPSQKQQKQRIQRKMPIERRMSKKQKQQVNKQQKYQIQHTAGIIHNNQLSVQLFVEKKDRYIGEELHGVPHGTGTKQYVNGDYYKGQWVNGLKEGKGEHYCFQLRNVYIGEWKHDLKNGNGHETQANGSWFEGQFRDGVKHGKGIYFDKQLNVKYSEIYMSGHLKSRKEINGQKQKILSDEFPTLKLDKQRFTTDDLVGFEQKNPEIKQLDLDFLLKYYGLRKVVNLSFIDTSISEWTIKEVHLFLEQINLQQYKTIFYDNKIRGKDLAGLDQQQMKQDLHMKLGDRKILINYINYVNSLNNNKKKVLLKDKNKSLPKRRQSLSIKKKKQNIFSSITQSIEHEIIEQDDEWNQPESDKESQLKIKQDKQKQKNQYETQKFDKYISRDVLNILNYHSHTNLSIENQDQTSDKTQKGSDVDRSKQFDVKPHAKRKKSLDKQGNANSCVGSICNNNNNNQNNGNFNNVNNNNLNNVNNCNGINKKQRQSTSSDSSQDLNENDEDSLFKIKRKKTNASNGPSQQIRQLYEFLRENQSLDFIIKQKDIEITEVIGEGGYGKVSRGRYMQCPVAVKDYMKAGRSHKSREEFMKEVHILSDLKHPNIVLYMGLCITVNRYQLVTQFMQNGSLYDQLHIKKTKFTKQQQLQIIDDIVQGMVYLHNMKRMLHRDLKSSNVLMADDYKVKLCDFGLSGHKNKRKKKKKNRIGTYQWMAPQVIRNQQLDFFSDVYSFGVIIWEMLTQRVPYDGMSEMQIIGDVGYDKNHKLPTPPKGADKFIMLIMGKCLQRDPASRPTFIQLQQLIKEQRIKRPTVRDVWNKKIL